MKVYDHWINGRAVPPSRGEWLESMDPYRGTAWAKVARGNQQDVNLAVSSARQAMTTGPWARMNASERGAVLRRMGDLLSRPETARLLAEMESRDNGKILAEMAGQLEYLPQHWYYFAGLADKVQGAVLPVDKADMLAMTFREPVGVVAALTAWNSPLMFFTLKCAPALAAGCSVVLKPSEFASISSLELARLTREAGLPDGVINVVTGLGSEVGAALVEHPEVAKVTFTGSDTTGARVYAAAARSMKRVSMELGGKSPNIVFEDADMDLACAGVVAGIFGAAGQMCTAGSRLLVQNSVKASFTSRLLKLAAELRLGDPMDAATQIGPMATAAQYQKVLHYIQVAREDGAECLMGGGPATGPGLQGGQFVQPTVFTGVTSCMRIGQEEVFGPVLSIMGFDDEAQAVQIGNDVRFGLAAGVWTRDIGCAVRMSHALQVGMVWVNTYRAYSCIVPIGGMKRSGLGRESGLEAIDEYLETKSVMVSTAASAPSNIFLQR